MKKAIFACVLLCLSTIAYADEDEDKVEIVGVVANGANIWLGQKYWNFPAPWNDISVVSSGAFNPNGGLALPLDPSMPDNTIIVNRVDPILSNFPTEFDENIPLRQIPTVISGGMVRGELQGILDVARDQQSKSLPNNTITLGEWAKAEGEAEIECHNDGTSEIKIKFKHMISNGLYTIWRTMGTSDGGLTAVPLGGTPNVFVPDSEGEAKFERTLKGCPMDIVAGEKPFLLIEVAYHSDGMIYGALPDDAVSGLPFGLQTNTHLNFPINIVSEID